MTHFVSGVTRHICIDIQGALRKSDKWLDGILQDAETGREMSPNEVRHFLRKQQEKGFSFFSGCDNMDSSGRCAGHQALEESSVQA
ncbi:hypothetical protein MO867_20135 [Microbulbifer sp. OS29]|uniref:Uncharacterized protein n=1 Tax=Microbulbifer okhotskensis TaxID=2926617 RepID=A0A9X2EVD2_9GAMM|nr:hypothetical protein [Microbulbifer okhotskensis]MCO1336638.1 hypothetical protein [Microbulbifer okhotskensis]